jgi:hypothetical protein
MTDDHGHLTTLGAVVRVGGLILGWLGSWKIGELQALAGLISALAVGIYAALQAYVLWQEKIAAKRNQTLT